MGSDQSQDEIQSGVITADNTTVVDWSTFKDSIKPETMSVEAWEAVWITLLPKLEPPGAIT